MYSQNNEEEIILQYFKDYEFGTFADIGANDGVTLSNTRRLAELGWKGILVDASAKAYARLVENYKGMYGFELYQSAITSHNGFVTLKESGNLISKDDIALVSTIHSHEQERFKSVVSYDPIEIMSMTWKTLIKCSSFKHFDFISIDVEGCEMDILPDIDLTHVKMLCIEWNGKPELKQAYEQYLFGFDLIHANGENLIYARP